MMESEEVYILTLSKWDPHQSAYADIEESMLNWEGNMVERRDRKQILLSNIEEDEAMAASVLIGAIELIPATSTCLKRLTKSQVY
jgi:hypothetical protein